jgi:small subunit ribosomal protein S30e
LKAERRRKKDRRAMYNRRFVNVVAGFGKKKGPNSNY